MSVNLKLFICISLLFLVYSCTKGNLKHERYINNNTASDTVVVINPDFDDAIDTIYPGYEALIYSFETLDTEQGYEPCAWLGDTLIIKNLSGEHLNRSVKVEGHWTYSISGDLDRTQRCTFVITDDDF